MSKLSFEQWKILAARNRDENDPEVAWQVCQKQNDEEIDGIRKQLIAQCKISSELLDEKEKLEDQNKNLQDALDGSTEEDPFHYTTYCANIRYQYDEEIKQLKEQIEKMKNCDNCKNCKDHACVFDDEIEA